MHKLTIPYKQTGFFTKLVVDFLEGNKKTGEFTEYPVTKVISANIIENKKRQTLHRPILHQVLQKQNEGLGLSEKTKKNIDLLLSENTFTVTTAHQPNLFLGPLYLIYKIISAINLAEQFKKQLPEYDFVPVFWMGSEDHDVAELNHIHLFNKKIEWDPEQSGAFGRMKTTSLRKQIDELKIIAGESDHAKDLIKLLEEAYMNHETIAQANRFLLNHFFAEYGLVIIDGDDRKLKELFSQVMKEELLNGTSFRLINETISKLEMNYPAQAKPREINLFYLTENKRERIIKEQQEYKVLNTSIIFQEAAMMKELESHPERFSPNVILRPLYQEMILPDIAFTGGGAELSYFMEMKTLFTHFKIHFPLLYLRNSALLMDEKTKCKWDYMELTPEDIFKDTEALIKKYMKAHTDLDADMKEESEKLEEIFSAISLKASAIDQTLVAAVEAEKGRQLNSLKAIGQKLLKGEKKKQETALQFIRDLKEKLFPGNHLQERQLNFMPWYLKEGKAFIPMLQEALDPLEFHFTIIYTG